MNGHGIKKVLITEEALSDLEKMVNNSKSEGLVDVSATYSESESTFEFELKYENKDKNGEYYTRNILINLENP